MAVASPTMETMMARNWWAPVLRGATAIIFGLVVWFWPGLALQTVILIFAIYSICSGILNMAEAVLSVADRQRWIPLALEGALSMGAGTVALVWPDLAAKTFLLLIAIWAILTGVLNLVSAVRLREEISDEWLLVLTGLAGIIFGTVAIARPQSGALAVLWLIGAFGIIIGALMIATGWRLRMRQTKPTAENTVEPGTMSGAHLEHDRTASDLPVAPQAQATTSPPDGDSASPVAAGVLSSSSIEGSTPSSHVAGGPNRRERALNDLIRALPPEGEGWRRGDGGLTAPDGYPLKGNINSRIYHAPSGRSYHETIADIYFATDDMAHQAGFRSRRETDSGVAQSDISHAARVPAPPDDQPSPVEGLDLADDQILDLDVLTMVEQPDSVLVDEGGSLETLNEVPASATEEHDDLEETKDTEGRSNQSTNPAWSGDDSTAISSSETPQQLSAASESFEEAELAAFDAELDEAIEETLKPADEPERANSEDEDSIQTAEPTDNGSEPVVDPTVRR